MWRKMMNKITLKELYLQTFNDTSGIKNYPLFKLLCEEQAFIFYNLMDMLNNNMYDYPLLKAYLTEYTSYNIYDMYVPHTKVNRSTLLDLLMLQTYGQRICNNVIDDFRYNFTPFKEQEVDYSRFSTELTFMLINRFAERWEKYLKELSLSYNPIDNYNMKENEKVNSKIITDNSDEHSVQGFNSSDYAPESKNKGSTTVKGSDEDNKRELTRSGNIGVTTSQQMLESEIKLRDENIFIKRILQDVANFITVGVYD